MNICIDCVWCLALNWSFGMPAPIISSYFCRKLGNIDQDPVTGAFYPRGWRGGIQMKSLCSNFNKSGDCVYFDSKCEEA